MSRPEERSGVTSPPSGNGSVPGLGEAFSINLGTGQGVYSYKLALPAGRAGHGAGLALEYRHGAGPGMFGLGWRLPLRAISRRLDFGVPGRGAAERWLDSGEELVETTDGTYGAARERAFTRYRRRRAGWVVEDRTGVVHECGLRARGRVADPDHPDRVQEWLLERSLDPSGNVVEYGYEHEDGVAYPASVTWAAYELRFVYEERPDVRQNARAGFVRTTARRCRAIELFLDAGTANERRVRSWAFGYRLHPGSGISLLDSIVMTSHGAAEDGADDVTRPPVSFGYSNFDPAVARVRFMEAPEGAEPPSLDTPDTALVTLDDAPLPGILQVVDERQLYWPNRGDGTWGAPREVGETPGIASFGASGALFADTNGSGTADLLVTGAQPLHGYFENGGTDGWTRFVPYPEGHAAAPPWESGTVRLTDVDGDGVVDALASGNGAFTLWRNRGADGWSEPEVRPIEDPDGPAGIDFADARVHLADLNGDGMQDLVRVSSGLVEYWPGLGDGRFGARVVMADSPVLPGLDADPAAVAFADIDGDGCDDLVFVDADGLAVAMNRSGREFAAPVTIEPLPAPLPGTLRAVNMNGGPGAGLLWCSLRFGRPAYVQVEFSPGEAAYPLTSVDNGSGLRSELSYRPAVEDFLRDAAARRPWRTHLPFPLLVVAGTREVDAVSGQETVVDYRYRDGHFDPATRQFHGFGRAERVEAGDESRPDTLTVFEFLMGQERLPGNGPEHVALNGELARTSVFALDGSADERRPYHVEESRYELRELPTAPGAARPRTVVAVVRHLMGDHDRTEDVRVEERRYDYDAFGNVVRERLVGQGTRSGVRQPRRARVTEIAYARATRRHIVDRIARIVERDETGAILRERRRYYDGEDFVGLPLGAADRGLLVREEQLVLSASDFEGHYEGMTAAELGYTAGVDADGVSSLFADVRRCAYDARGLKLAGRDALGNEERYEYDPDGLFRVLLRDSLGDTRYTYDRAAGQPTDIEYANGSIAGFRYDAQGRVIASLLPGDDAAAPPRRYAYDDGAVPGARWAFFRAEAGDAATATAVTYFDGHGKEFQQRAEAGEGRVIVSGLSLRNPWGEVRREYEPTDADSLAFALPDTDGRAHRSLRYDARGRVVESSDFTGGVSRAEHRPFEVVLYDAGRDGTPRREEVDVLGDRVRTVQELDDGAAATTRFAFGPAGDLIEVHDDSGRLSACAYDRRGGRLAIDHREGGRRRVFRDARGLVVRSLDADGRDLRAEIDAQGRLTRLELDGTTMEELTYDDPARNALGRLDSVSYPGGRQDLHYDAAGRLLQHTYRFDGADRAETLEYEYDALGREVAITHTDGRRIARELTPNGWVRAIEGVLAAVRYDARGLPTHLRYANGVTSELAYTEGPGRVRSQRTTGPAGQLLHDVRYERDALGLVSRTDDATPGGAGVCEFSYDPLLQLTALSANGGSPAGYTYDRLFNLTGLGDTGAGLHYDDVERPYRLTGATPAGGALEDVGYDSGGNQTSHGASRFSYDYKQALTRFEDGRGLVADYRYDHRGVRISKAVANGGGAPTRTFFVGADAEIRNGTPTLYVRLGQMRVAVLHPQSTRFVHPDPLGTTAFFTDEAGAKIAAISFLPFGNVAASVGDIDERTFGSHPFDAESGLYYMQRRHYDPAKARFLQPDPIAVLKPERYVSAPRAFHPYAYAGNDPVNNADPDGMTFWSVVGAIFGVAAAIGITALAVFVMPVVAAAAIAVGVMTVSYLVGAATAGTDFGEFMRGFSIGLNAGLNAMLGSLVWGPIVGIALGIVNFLAAFDGVASANGGTYQSVLGWSSWLMPMSWLVNVMGLGVFLFNVVAAGLTGNKPGTRSQITGMRFEWSTGAIVTYDGFWTPNTSWNLGNFVYIDDPADEAHEFGHLLQVAAFGSIWHLMGAWDENAWPFNNGWNAPPEQYAESHVPPGTSGRYPIEWWGEMWS